jgi:hypothetical protein
MTRISGFALIGAMIVGTGCTESLTGTPWGYVAAAVTDDPAITNGAATGAQGAGVQKANGSLIGTFEATAEVAILRNGSGWVSLGAPVELSTALQRELEAASFNGRAGLPVGTYSRARLALSDARVVLHAGSYVDGVELTEDRVIPVGMGEAFEIEKAIAPFTLTSRTRVRVLFDLNAQDWVDSESLDLGDVEEYRVAASTVALRLIEPR